MFLGLLDPHPDPLVTGTYPALEKIVGETLIPTVLCLLYDFLSLKNDVPVFRIRRIRLRLLDPLARGTGTGRIRNTGFYLNSPFIFRKSSTASYNR
jgi:hypothetical protein